MSSWGARNGLILDVDSHLEGIKMVTYLAHFSASMSYLSDSGST